MKIRFLNKKIEPYQKASSPWPGHLEKEFIVNFNKGPVVRDPNYRVHIPKWLVRTQNIVIIMTFILVIAVVAVAVFR